MALKAVGSNLTIHPIEKKHAKACFFSVKSTLAGGWNTPYVVWNFPAGSEIAAAVGGFYFAFCGAENFTTAERLFHILHMQNISLIFNVELIRLFFLLLESVSETWRTSGTEQQSGGRLRPRATKRPQARESNPATPTRKKHFFGSAFFNEINPCGFVKYPSDMK